MCLMSLLIGPASIIGLVVLVILVVLLVVIVMVLLGVLYHRRRVPRVSETPESKYWLDYWDN